MEFAKTLKTLIRQQASSVNELAREINVSPKTINDWLTGRTPRDLDAVKRCAEFFKVSVHFLLYGEEDKKNLIEELLEKTELHTGLYEITVRKVSSKRNNN
jgi:transcriptional regulator with XRE-family HTH domain